MIASDSQQTADVRRMQLELEELRAAKKQSDLRAGQTAATAAPGGTRPAMLNLLRNTDASHSVNTWFETEPSGGAKDFEAANIYTHPADAPFQVSDGAILLASLSTLRCIGSAPFVSTDAGKIIVIPGAGASGADLSTTIAAFVSHAEVTLTDAAAIVADASNLTVRFRLQKLGKKTSKTNSGEIVNDALKDAAHANYDGNLTGADWVKSNGTMRLGTTDTIDFPFGYYLYVPDDGSGNGTTFVPLHSLFPGRTIFARVNMARRSKFIKPKGVFYFGIWNNHDSALEFAHGTAFSLTGGTTGTPLAATVAKYMVVIETDQNYSIVSQILTLPASPDDGNFNPTVYNTFSWTRFAGALRYKIYRKLGAGNVFLLEGDSPTNNYIDNNPAQRVDTGSASFPNPGNARVGVSAYVSTASGALDQLPVNGEADWTAIEVLIPFPTSINLGKFSDPFLRIGFTENAAFQTIDAVTDATNVVTSAEAQFVAPMVGKAFVLRDSLDSTKTVAGTISAVGGPTSITLSQAASWTSENNILEIADSAAHGILFDLAGASLNEGTWSPHVDDITNRPQIAVSNPNGSSQGGIGGSGEIGTGEEGGYVYPGRRYPYPSEDPQFQQNVY